MGGKISLIGLQTRLAILARQLTWPWMVSLALLAACVAFYLSVIFPMRHAVDALKQNVRDMQRNESRLQQASLESMRKAPAGQLDMFENVFPPESSVPDTVEKLIDLAQSKGLNPKQAEYRLNRKNPGSLLSYQISLPITGPYPKIFAFVFDLLANVHNISLDNIGFQRQKIGDASVEATLSLTLYIKRGPGVEH